MSCGVRQPFDSGEELDTLDGRHRRLVGEGLFLVRTRHNLEIVDELKSATFNSCKAFLAEIWRCEVERL